MSDVSTAETILGGGLPALVIGDGPRAVAYLPGLSSQVGLPTGRERAMAIAGWEPLTDRFSVYRISRLARPIGTSFAQMAEDHAVALEGLDPPVDLMGASTGGAIAMEVAAARPDLVRRLVLVNTGASMSPNGARGRDRVFGDIEAGRWRSAYREIFAIGSASAWSRTLMGTLAWAIGPRLVPPPDDSTIILTELAAWRTFDGAAIAASIKAPTIVIGTDRDPMFGPTYATDLAALIPGSQVVTFPGLAHAFPPTAIEEHISPFLG